VVACAVLPRDLAASLRARVERNELAPTGFQLDLGLGEDLEGEPVRDARALPGDVLELTLRHVDPEAAVRAEGGRLALLRAALLVVSVLTAGAGLATFRALRRERRLAELKSAFVANVSHELRTPLASILMLAENLEAGRVGDEGGRARYHALIRREAERLRRLVADVLDFSRLERGKGVELRREALEVDALASSLREEAVSWAQRAGFELALDVEPAAGKVEVDLDALRRCVVNLLENARKHSGEGGATLSVQVVPGELVVAVEDAGRGVPEESRARIFEPFTRLERDDGAAGTGLGLAIVREIARAHGGEVTLRPGTGGRGARFEVRLPLLRPSEEEVRA
jgi:signal transduction histidine kinase